MEEFAGVPGLGDRVGEVQACHVFVRDLGVDADHLGVFERLDEGKHRAGGGEEDVAARLVGLGLERELDLVPLVLHVAAQEIHRLAHPFQCVERVLPRVRFRSLPTAPENVDAGSQRDAQVDRVHRFLKRIGADFRIVARERAVAEGGIAEEIRGGHRHHEPGVRERLPEAGDDLPARRGRCVDRHEVVVVKVHAPRADFGEQAHDFDRRQRCAHRRAERVAARVADGP